jgi:hypothetical protein
MPALFKTILTAFINKLFTRMSNLVEKFIETVRDVMDTELARQYPATAWDVAFRDAGKLHDEYQAKIDELEQENQGLKTSLKNADEYRERLITKHSIQDDLSYEKEMDLKNSLEIAKATIQKLETEKNAREMLVRGTMGSSGAADNQREREAQGQERCSQAQA